MNPLPITPLRGPVRATVSVPGSKSLTNRALAIGALAGGRTTLTNALFSDDSHHFADSLARLGFRLRADAEQGTITVHGLGGRIPADRAELYVGNAGTAARFLTAIAALGHGEYLVDGVERMRQRPIADLLDALGQLGAVAHSVHGTGCPPVRVTASGLRGGTARVRAEASSQFLSALLIAAPCAQSPVELVVEGRLNSRPYVDMTIAVMADFGARVERDGYGRFRVAPQQYQAQSAYAVEADASAASYFFAAPAICGGAARVQNISRRSKQGDTAFLDVLEAMGCAVTAGDRWIEVAGPGPKGLAGVEVDLRDIPDTAQTLAAIAPFAASPTILRGIASARRKETDRVAAMCAELRRLGVTVDEYPDGLKVYPCDHIRPATIRTYDDHRMAMAFALVGLRADGVAIENPGCVSKTFPDYFEVLGSLRE